MGLIFNDCECFVCGRGIKNYRDAYRLDIKNILTGEKKRIFVCCYEHGQQVADNLPNGWVLV